MLSGNGQGCLRAMITLTLSGPKNRAKEQGHTLLAGKFQRGYLNCTFSGQDLKGPSALKTLDPRNNMDRAWRREFVELDPGWSSYISGK